MHILLPLKMGKKCH